MPSARERLQTIAGNDRLLQKQVFIKGEDFSFQMYPLTLAEQKAADKLAKGDLNDTALQLLCKKALDENLQPMFNVGDIPFLRNTIEKHEIEKLLLALIVADEEEAVLPNPKRPESRVQKGKAASV